MTKAGKRPDLDQRVARVAASALAERKVVTAIDVLMGLGWLPQVRVDEWRQGRVDCIERVVTANLHKISTAMRSFRKWARQQGLRPSETVYVARTRDRRRLRFSRSGDAAVERAYSTHWVSPELSARKQQRLTERQSRPPDLVVVEALHHDWACAVCGGTGRLLLMEDRGPICMRCARLDHLVFLEAGDAKLTRRAHRASGVSAVALRFSRARQRYERQGLLVEEAALEAAERECLGEAEATTRRRLRAGEAPQGG